MLKSQKQRKIFRRDRGVVVYFDSPKYPIQDFMSVMSCKKIMLVPAALILLEWLHAKPWGCEQTRKSEVKKLT